MGQQGSARHAGRHQCAVSVAPFRTRVKDMRVLTPTALALVFGAGAALAALPAAATPNCPTGAPTTVAQGAGPPPPLIREQQPPAPGYGYMWTPGYWDWNPVLYDYYWTPGIWVLPPAIGLLW